MIWRRTALGWIQLTHNKARFFTAIAGVAFAAILLFMQLGFRNMLLDTTVMLHKRLDADIVLVSTKARDMNNPGTFPRRRLAQALGVPGVVEGEALYVMTRDMIVPSGPRQGERAPMLVLGVRPDFNAFKDPEITRNQPLLTVSGTVLFDRGSRFDYTALKASVVRAERPTVELGGKTATIEGLFHIGSSFGNEGNIVTSEESFFLYALNRTSSAPNLGLIRVAAGQDPAEVAGRISAAIAGFDDTQALTLQQYIDHSQRSLARNSPINYIFSFGAFMGLIVGTVVVVQILSADVQDHLPEYATFKAIGFTNRYLLGVIAEQSMVLTVAGFVPGFLVSLGGYELVRRAIAMPIAMPFGRVAFVFGLIAAMCIVSGIIAMQRVRGADPAEVF